MTPPVMDERSYRKGVETRPKAPRKLGPTDDGLAFHDAPEVSDTAMRLLDGQTLRPIARELVDTLKQNVTVDWTVKESGRAKLRVTVTRILRNHGCPPGEQEATNTVPRQAELPSDPWTKARTE